LRALLRETRGWGDDVDTFAALVRSGLIELRDRQHVALNAQDH
jgi:hypothetical protein